MTTSPCITPSSFGGISYSMLTTALSGCQVVYKPRNVRRLFRWFEPVYGDEVFNGLAHDQSVLVLCQKEFAKGVLKRNQEAFVVALSADEEVPDWVQEFNYRSRVLVIRQQKRFSQYATYLHELFTSYLIWETEMDRVVFSRKSLDKLIEVSEYALGNFVCITDTGYNLITCSRNIEPPEGALSYQKLVQDGCYDSYTIAQLVEKVLARPGASREPIVLEPNDECGFATLHYPVYINDSYLFHATMVCHQGSIDLNIDLFKRFAKRVVMEANEFWKNTVNLEAPWHRMLLALIDGKPVTQDYLTTQLSNTDIPNAKSFRVLYLPFDKSIPQIQRSQIVEESKRLNGGNAYPFMRKGCLVVLCYTLLEGESHLSGNKLWNDAMEVLFKPFGVQAGASQLFTKIEDLGKAFNEANIAYGLRGPVMREYKALIDETDVPIFPFEHALKFYVLSEGHDTDIVDFAFRDSILSHIVSEDNEKGTELAQMIWAYISHGRNATETGRMMHTHRNTVLYHIGRIEERFDISFDSPLLRSRMVLDYQRLLLEESI